MLGADDPYAWSVYDLDDGDDDDAGVAHQQQFYEDAVENRPVVGAPITTSPPPQQAPASSTAAEELRRLLRKHKLLGRGAQGVLYSASFTDDPERREVVVKRLTAHHQLKSAQGFVTGHMRELALLQKVTHENIVKLHRVVTAPHREVCLVLEKYDIDVETLVIKRGIHPNLAVIKQIVQSVLRACSYLHAHGVMHRDIKPSNIGIMRDGTVKLADFGSARMRAPEGGRYTPVTMTTTLTYSAPELLLGHPQHTPAVDLWAVGVVLADLVTGKHFFTARSQLEMLSKAFEAVGTPTEETWPQFRSTPACSSFTFEQQPSTLASRFSGRLSDAGLDLLQRLLDPSPTQRISSEEALAHPWFSTTDDPPPAAAPEVAGVVAAGVDAGRKRTSRPGVQASLEALLSNPPPNEARRGPMPDFACLGDDSGDDDDDIDSRFE